MFLLLFLPHFWSPSTAPAIRLLSFPTRRSSDLEFLEHYRTAAVPTRSAAPRDKGHVESGVKIVTNWVIHYLADRVLDRKSTRLSSSHVAISYAVFCLKKKIHLSSDFSSAITSTV